MKNLPLNLFQVGNTFYSQRINGGLYVFAGREMKELIEKIQTEMAAFSKDADAQLVKGNKAAGTRARKAALEISKLMKEFRKVSLEEAKK